MTTVERKEKLNIQISLDPFLLFVLTSVLVHGLGVLILVLSNRSLPTARQETESTPIDFIVVPPEESPEEPPPDTERRAANNSVAKGQVNPELPSATNKIGNEEAITTPKPSQAVQPKRQAAPLVPKTPQTPPAPKVEPKPVTPPPSPTKVPKQETAPSNPTPPVASKPKPRENAPLFSESNPTSIPLPKPAPLQEEKPSREIETASPQTDLPPVATKLPTKPIPTETPSQSTETAPPASEQQTPVGSGSASLLGGTYRKTLADNSGSSFFNPQANASQQALNSSGLDARQDLNMGPYFAEIRRRVRRNWQPSSPGNNRHTVLAFSIQRNGQVTGLRIVQSSGSEKVDRDSVAAVQKSAPFAALPANFPDETLDVKFSFNIYVNHGVFTPQLENWQRF